MAEEKIWDATWPTVQGFLDAADNVIGRKGNGAAVQVNGSHIVARRVVGGPFVAPGRIFGGFGAESTAGTADWNHVSNAASGAGFALLSDAAANSPPSSGYFHPFCFEYSSKDGSGNMTQLAVPYNDGSGYFGMRFRYEGQWSAWRSILMQNPDGRYLPPVDNSNSLGASSRRFSTLYAASGSINTSDERQKDDIEAVPDEWLDAWGDVSWSRYRFKGGRRWHVGLVAQRVYAAFAARGLDAFDIGLCCYDAWEEEISLKLDDGGNIVGKGDVTRPAGELWGLRYDECFAMEAAWVRRELARLGKGG